jgi:hypothetical protein
VCLWGSLVSALAEVAAWESELVGDLVSGLVANISIKTSNSTQSIERCKRVILQVGL